MNRSTKLWLVPAACFALGVGVVACGDDDDNGDDGAGGTAGFGTGGTGATGGTGGTGGTPGTGGTGGTAQTISVSGNVEGHPLAGEVDLDFGEMELRLVDAQAALVDPNEAVLATTEVESDGSFSFEDVDISDAGVGVVLTAEGGEDIVTSSMGLCQLGAGIPAVLECRDRDDFVAFVVPQSLATTLSGNLENDDLVTNGFVLGMVVEGMMNPIPGVEIEVSGGDVVALEPALTPTGNNITTDAGAFVVTGQPGLVNIGPQQAGTAFVPPSQPVGISPAVAFQVFFTGADEGNGGDGGNGD